MKRRLLGYYPVIQTLQTHLRTHKDKVKKGFFYCSFMKSDPQQSSENLLSFWTHMQTGINFFFLFLPCQMNNIYEQYHVCVCWEKQNIHRNKLMNNAVISFLTFNTALGQLLNNQSDLVPLWFDMCQCFLSPPPPPWATGPYSEIFSVFNISSAEHKNPKSRRSSNIGVENQQRHPQLSRCTGTFCTCWRAEQAHRFCFSVILEIQRGQLLGILSPQSSWDDFHPLWVTHAGRGREAGCADRAWLMWNSTGMTLNSPVCAQ